MAATEAFAVVGWHPGATQRRHHHRRQQQQPPRPPSAPDAAAGLAGSNLGGGSCCVALLAADGFFLTAPPEPQPLVLAAAAAVSAALQSLPSTSIRLLTARQRSSPRGSASPDCRLGQQRVPAVVSVELQRAGSSDTASQGAAASHRRRAAAAQPLLKLLVLLPAGQQRHPGMECCGPASAVLAAACAVAVADLPGLLLEGCSRRWIPASGRQRRLLLKAHPGHWACSSCFRHKQPQQQLAEDDRRHTHDDLGSRGGCASLNGNGSQQQQQMAEDRPRALSVGEPARGGTGSTSSPAGVSDGSAASLPSERCSMMPTRPAVVPRLRLSRLQIVPPHLSALASNTQQKQLHASGCVTACVDAVSAGASLLPASLPRAGAAPSPLAGRLVGASPRQQANIARASRL